MSSVAPWMTVLALLLGSGCAAAPGRAHRAAQGFSTQTFGAVWDDRTRCEEALQAGRTLARGAHKLRLVSWDLDDFPAGVPGADGKRRGSDVNWIACVLASLRGDVIALQSVYPASGGKAALAALVVRLRELTGADWHLELDTCADPAREHVALLARLDRVAFSHPRSDVTLDASERTARDSDRACPGRQPAALGAYMAALGGGVDLHVVAVSLARGVDDTALRAEAVRRLPDLIAERLRLVADDDVVIAGTFGFAGAAGERASRERRELAAIVASSSAPMRPLGAADGCTGYAFGKAIAPGAVMVRTSMREAEAATLQVTGVCAAKRCQPIAEKDVPSFLRLSRACPIVVDVPDHDDDGPAPAASAGAAPSQPALAPLPAVTPAPAAP